MGRVRHWRLPRPRASVPCAPALRGPAGRRVLPLGGLAAPRTQRSRGLPLSCGGHVAPRIPPQAGPLPMAGRALGAAHQRPICQRRTTLYGSVLLPVLPPGRGVDRCLFGPLARRGQLAVPAGSRHCPDDCPPPLLAGGRHAYRPLRGLVPLAPGSASPPPRRAPSSTPRAGGGRPSILRTRSAAGAGSGTRSSVTLCASAPHATACASP